MRPHLPDRFKASITRYLEHGVMPGDFLTAVLSNDLFSAFAKADETSLAELHGLVGWCYYELPHDAWGSRERVEAYCAANQADRVRRVRHDDTDGE